MEGRAALITPHAAEFALLAGVSVRKVLDTRFDIGADVAAKLGATVLLKGSPTVIFAPDGGRYVVARGTAERVRYRGFMTFELDDAGLVSRFRQWPVARTVGVDSTVDPEPALPRLRAPVPE